MTWIKSVTFDEATGRLREIYERIKGPRGYLDNILTAHGLRPHTLEGHMALYKAVLHHTGNRLPKSFLETLGIYVSVLNGCDYCVKHHAAGLRRLLNDPAQIERVHDALVNEDFDDVFDQREQAALRYTAALTESPGQPLEPLVVAMREAGYDDGEILEVNQVASYFAYANRLVLGLGISHEGDTLGLSPGDDADPENWRHL